MSNEPFSGMPAGSPSDNNLFCQTNILANSSEKITEKQMKDFILQPLLGNGYLSISSSADVTLTNPCPTVIDANFSTSSRILRFPVMDAANSLLASNGATIKIRNTGTHTFTVVNNGSNYFYEILPGAIVTFQVTSNATPSGLFNDVYPYLPAVTNEVAYGIQTPIIGNKVFGSSDEFTYNPTTQTLEFPHLKTNTIGDGYYEINDGISHVLINPMPTVVNVTYAGGGLSITLPSMTETAALQADRLPSFYVYNNGLQQVDILKSNLSLLVTIYPGEGYQITVTSNATPEGSFIFERIKLPAASITREGYVTTGAQTIAGDKTFTGAITASNLSGTNHGDLTTDVVSTSTPNATGMQLTAGSPSTAQKLQLCAATATFPGIITETTQTIGGDKTFTGAITMTTITGGFEPPQVTTAQRIAQSPTRARIVYDTDLDQYFGWEVGSSSWVILG